MRQEVRLQLLAHKRIALLLLEVHCACTTSHPNQPLSHHGTLTTVHNGGLGQPPLPLPKFPCCRVPVKHPQEHLGCCLQTSYISPLAPT